MLIFSQYKIAVPSCLKTPYNSLKTIMINLKNFSWSETKALSTIILVRMLAIQKWIRLRSSSWTNRLNKLIRPIIWLNRGRPSQILPILQTRIEETHKINHCQTSRTKILASFPGVLQMPRISSSLKETGTAWIVNLRILMMTIWISWMISSKWESLRTSHICCLKCRVLPTTVSNPKEAQANKLHINR